MRKLARADRRVKRRSWKPHLGWRVIGQDGEDGDDGDEDDRRVETVISVMVKHNQCDGRIISCDDEA